MNLDLSKASGLECIPVVVLQKCGPEVSYMPTELFQAFFQAYSTTQNGSKNSILNCVITLSPFMFFFLFLFLKHS